MAKPEPTFFRGADSGNDVSSQLEEKEDDTYVAIFVGAKRKRQVRVKSRCCHTFGAGCHTKRTIQDANGQDLEIEVCICPRIISTIQKETETKESENEG